MDKADPKHCTVGTVIPVNCNFTLMQDGRSILAAWTPKVSFPGWRALIVGGVEVNWEARISLTEQMKQKDFDRAVEGKGDAVLLAMQSGYHSLIFRRSINVPVFSLDRDHNAPPAGAARRIYQNALPPNCSTVNAGGKKRKFFWWSAQFDPSHPQYPCVVHAESPGELILSSQLRYASVPVFWMNYETVIDWKPGTDLGELTFELNFDRELEKAGFSPNPEGHNCITNGRISYPLRRPIGPEWDSPSVQQLRMLRRITRGQWLSLIALLKGSKADLVDNLDLGEPSPEEAGEETATSSARRTSARAGSIRPLFRPPQGIRYRVRLSSDFVQLICVGPNGKEVVVVDAYEDHAVRLFPSPDASEKYVSTKGDSRRAADGVRIAWVPHTPNWQDRTTAALTRALAAP